MMELVLSSTDGLAIYYCYVKTRDCPTDYIRDKYLRHIALVKNSQIPRAIEQIRFR